MPALRRAAARATAVLLAVSALAGCGTATFDNTVSVVVRGAVEPQTVSVFDPQMGSTRDWAKRSAGTTAPGAPYTATVFATDTKLVFDSSPPRRVVLGMWLPEISDAGFYQVTVEPQDGVTVAVDAGLVPWTEGARPGVAPLPVEVAAAATGQGWTLALAVTQASEP